MYIGARLVAKQTPTKQTPAKNLLCERDIICKRMEKHASVLALISLEISRMRFCYVLSVFAGPLPLSGTSSNRSPKTYPHRPLKDFPRWKRT